MKADRLVCTSREICTCTEPEEAWACRYSKLADPPKRTLTMEVDALKTKLGSDRALEGETVAMIMVRWNEDRKEAAAALAKLQAERDEAREALRRLNERKAMYDRSSRNQADAYYNLVKGADADWLAASRAMGGGE